MIKQKRPPSSMKDFVNLLIDKGNFSICRLPHYRFRGEQSHYDRLRKAGMVVVTGKDEVTLNLRYCYTRHTQVRLGVLNDAS